MAGFLLEFADNALGALGVVFLVEHLRWFRFPHTLIFIGVTAGIALVLTIIRRRR